jgi:tRNA modification GTPase
MANPGEFTQRAYLNGKLDLAQAEAVADLIASTDRPLTGSNEPDARWNFERVETVAPAIIALISLIELELDFSEEEVEFADRKQLSELLDKISGVVNRLIKSFSLAMPLKMGYR